MVILPTAYFCTATLFDESAHNNNKIKRKKKNKIKVRKEIKDA